MKILTLAGENHSTGWVGTDAKGDQIPTSMPQAGPPSFLALKEYKQKQSKTKPNQKATLEEWSLTVTGIHVDVPVWW